MRKIVVFGAGLSSSVLIDYLVERAEEEQWVVRVGDRSLQVAEGKTKGRVNTQSFQFDVSNQAQVKTEVQAADIVISMLPAHMHVEVAKTCIRERKNMVTASYISREMAELKSAAESAGVIIMNEIGVDPGIDHMSAMKVIHQIQNEGGRLLQFETFTGGLPAPQSDDNLWHYKFAWNPRNVVLAGAGGAVKFRQEGQYKYIPYHQVFRRIERIELPGYGKFEGYANRDSLKYMDAYGLSDIPTIYRGTLRRPGFCRAWNVFVMLGATDDSYIVEGSENMTQRQFLNLFLAYNPHDSIELKLMHYLKLDQDNDIMDKMAELGLFSEEKVGIKNATPAQMLQHILEKNWTMTDDDRDMIVMYHLFGYELNGERKKLESSMVIEGADRVHTAMAKTVGLPVAIVTKLILNGVITRAGVHAPLSEDIYSPVLAELSQNGISFIERESEYEGY